MSEGRLLVRDSRNNREYEIPIKRNTVAAVDFKQIKSPETDQIRDDKGSISLKVYDPGLANTAIIESDLLSINTPLLTLKYRDAERGTLLFRGYSIGQLWDSSFEDVLHLMVWGALPSASQKRSLQQELSTAMLDVPDEVFGVIHAFPQSAPPLPMIVAGLSAYLANRPQDIPAVAGGNIYHGNRQRVNKAIVRVVAAWAVVIGLSTCHRRSIKFVPASPDQTFYENLFIMMGHVNEITGKVDLKKLQCFQRFGALSIDHGMANSTFAMLVTCSTLADPLSALISALTAAYGPLHFGAPESAYRTMTQLGKPENVPSLIEEVKRGERRLFGYGHRSYRTDDPRIRPIKILLDELDAASNPLLAVAREIDRIASNDEYFKSRGLHANADLYGVFFYIAMGFAPEYIPLMMLTQRLPGIMAHWRDAMLKRGIKVIRPTHVESGDGKQANDRVSKL